ncbi:MAG: 5-hydroxyisourate hydrolase [Chlamydiales bacterium]|jgi:5-hydroxyisourate hydrolase
MISISSHILNTHLGKPAKTMLVVLEHETGDGIWSELTEEESNDDGRVEDFDPGDSPFQPGVYRLIFDTKKYFSTIGQDSFYPSVCVVFQIDNPDQHYHIPLLLNNYGYTTYRGS